MTQSRGPLATLRRRRGVRAVRPSTSSRGAAFIEYVLLVALIAVACIVALTFLGDQTATDLSRSGSVIADS